MAQKRLTPALDILLILHDTDEHLSVLYVPCIGVTWLVVCVVMPEDYLYIIVIEFIPLCS
jgi:hypothetical protein